MIKTTRWKPDTCSCVIDYEWDDSISVDSREHTFKRFIKQCSIHQELDWTKTLQHNQEKNQAIMSIKETMPELLKADGEFIDNIKPMWEIKDGKMIVSVNKLTKTGVEKII